MNLLITNKKILLLISLLISTCKIYSQEIIGFQGEINYIKYEGLFAYALKVDNHLYYTERPKKADFSHIVYKSNILQKGITLKHYCSGPDALKNFSWLFLNDQLFSVAYWGTPGQLQSYIYYRPFEKNTPEELERMPPEMEIKQDYIWISPLKDYQESFYKRKYKIPSKDELRLMYESLDFDMVAYDTNRILFYIRDNCKFWIWSADLIKKPDVERWQLIKSFNCSSVDMDYPPNKYYVTNSLDSINYVGINDSLFFDGHYKVIIQNDETFIINRNHGYIFYLGKKKIERIGQVFVKEDYPKIQGKPLFIEDRDNNEIIFFAPVKWEENKLPKPNVRIMDEKEMKEKFKYALE